jgi:hypothetical protein
MSEELKRCPKDNDGRWIEDGVCAEAGYCLHPGCYFNPWAPTEEETKAGVIKYTQEEYAKDYAEFLRQVKTRDKQAKNKHKI